MPSATTADNSDSMAPSSANATAFGSTSRTLSQPTSGSDGNGRPLGMPPKREPIVTTSSPAPAVTAAAPATAINMPGQSGRQRFRPTMTAIVASDTAIVVPSNVGRERQRTGSLSISSPGSGSASASPKRSLS